MIANAQIKVSLAKTLYAASLAGMQTPVIRLQRFVELGHREAKDLSTYPHFSPNQFSFPQPHPVLTPNMLTEAQFNHELCGGLILFAI